MRHGPGSRDTADPRLARLAEQLDVPTPFTMEGLRSRLEHHCQRPVRMRSTDLPYGAPSGVWARTDTAEFLFYEKQTSAFHQVHIVATLAAHVLLAGPDGGTISPRLVPDVRPQCGRMLPEAGIDDAVSRSEAEAFAFILLRRAGSFPGNLRARALLRRIQPLHSVLLAQVPAAACPTGPGSPNSATARLYRTVIEIHDAALVTRAHGAPQSTAIEEAALFVEGSDFGGTSQRHCPGSDSFRAAYSSDLRHEASKLAEVSRRFTLATALQAHR
jgi:hypothetical protein